MKKQLIYFGIIMLFFISIVSAVNPCGNDNSFLGTFKQNNQISLTQICDSCTYVNISTISYPDSVQVVVNAVMTKSGVNYNYTLVNTSLIGCYSYSVYGDKSGVLSTENINFAITSDGQALGKGTTTFLIFLALAIVLLIIAFIFHNYIFSFFSGLTFLVTGVYSMIYTFTTVLQEYTRMISFIILGIGAIITIVSSIDLINELSEGGDSYTVESDNDD